MAACISFPEVFFLCSLRVDEEEDFRFNPTKESEECLNLDLELSFPSPAAVAVSMGSNLEVKRRDSKRREKKLTDHQDGGCPREG
jgi:hypothetical protein